MRLIDADAFVKELEIWHRNALAEKAELNAFFSSNFIDMVNMMPTVDAVPVIRCKNCRNSEPWYADERRCFLWSENGISVFDDGFCNYAERKDE